MTNPTPHGQVPASSAVLKAIREANMQLVRTGDDAFMLVPYRHAHVQKPAEIEHVAGDVSKNGAELDMTQQPAPTPQADSQPAPVVDRDRIREIFMAHGFVTKEGQTDLKQYVYDAADALLRAARAPADSVTAPAGGVVAYLDIGAGGYLDLDAALSDEAMQQLPKGRHALVIAGTYGIDGYVAAPQPSPTAQADSQPAPDNEAILSAARNWGDVQQYNRTDGKGTEHRIVFSMPKRAAHFARELLAARKQGGA